MALLVYSLCLLTSLACAGLLLRAWRREGVRLLLYAGLCFTALALNNAVLILDFQVFPDIDLSILRTSTTAVGVGILLFGLVWESR